MTQADEMASRAYKMECEAIRRVFQLIVKGMEMERRDALTPFTPANLCVINEKAHGMED